MMRKESWKRAYETLCSRDGQILTPDEERLLALLSPTNSESYIEKFIEDNPDINVMIRMLAN